MFAPRYTHGHSETVVGSHRTRTAGNSAAYLLPLLQPGMRLLDIGSGPGSITADLAAILSEGTVTAVEINEDVIALTRAEIERRGLANVDYAVGDIHALDLPDDAFDVVHAHQVLQHVADPVQALREMVRVCRPGGIVAVRDADYAGFVWYPESDGLTRWLELYEHAARENGGEPDAGRRLLAWAREAGCTDVVATSSTWCYADDDSRAVWGSMWADRIVGTAIAGQLLASGAATREELEAIAESWRAWAADPDGWISLVHGELVIRVPV